MLERGRGVIVLLPEIALTPQTLAIFCARYGDRVAVMHSALSAGERLDAYHRVRSGEATVVVGTRSAVFAPVKDLGLIVMDEEHEHTYKSDMNPKYHARDVARYRTAHNKALLLLCSATP
jgi:primosomal protein N' (replication factor Y)